MRIRRRTVMSAGLVVALFGVTFVAGAAAAGNTLRIEPATTAVARDATFRVRVVQNAEVATSGAQATITFDPTLLQITTVTRGSPYASAELFLAGDEPAIAAANSSGTLSTVAAAFLPPGSIPAGDADFLIVEFKAVACGQVALGLPVGPADAALLDGTLAAYGTALMVTTTAGTASIDCASGGAASANPVPNAVGPTSPASTSNGGPPWVLLGIGLVVVAVAAGGLWFRRGRA